MPHRENIKHLNIPATLIILLLAAMAVLPTGCTGSGKGNTPTTQPKDTTYTQRAAMMVYDYDPVRALQIIDSAVVVGNLSDWWADKNRMRILSMTRVGKHLDSLMRWAPGARFDSVRAIGERLLRHDSIRSSLADQQDVLEMLAYAARQQNNTTAWLQHSRQLVSVCRQQGAETEALRNEAEVGAALCWMGQQREGMAMLDRAIDALQALRASPSPSKGGDVELPSAHQTPPPLEGLGEAFRFNELDALVIALKRKIGVMTASGQSVEVLPLARRIVTLMDDYEAHPDQYHDGTYREPPAEKRDDYIRFYRTQAENYIASAYAALGNTKDMKATFERLENIVRYAEAREHQARYRALEQQMAAQRQQLEMEAVAQRNLYFAVVVCLLLALALAALAWYFRQMRIAKEKNRYLVQYIEKSLTPTPLPREGEVERGAGGEADPDAEAFAQIHDTIIRERLYLDPACDRQMLTDRFGLSKERLGSLFGQYSDARNVAAFINGLRLAHAAHLLTTQSDLDIRQVAAASGFGSHQYFSTCFKQRYGLSPTDYRAAKGL